MDSQEQSRWRLTGSDKYPGGWAVPCICFENRIVGLSVPRAWQWVCLCPGMAAWGRKRCLNGCSGSLSLLCNLKVTLAVLVFELWGLYRQAAIPQNCIPGPLCLYLSLTELPKLTLNHCGPRSLELTAQPAPPGLDLRLSIGKVL